MHHVDVLTWQCHGRTMLALNSSEWLYYTLRKLHAAIPGERTCSVLRLTSGEACIERVFQPET